MYIIGLMSGTSLDGLDVAYVEIVGKEPLEYRLIAAETLPYTGEWVSRLSSLEKASAFDYALADVQLGHYFGQKVVEFRERHPGRVDMVASHGHTVFHQPHLGLTTQIGSGDAIAAETGLPVAFNFRTFDVALGGQGAPLVPVGDRLLFGEYDMCLNLGGIANISFESAPQHLSASRRVAYDICPCNMALNTLSQRVGQPYDRDGMLARGGVVDEGLLSRMDALPYYGQEPPKTLGKEWFVSQFLPLLQGEVPDLLATTVEHIARQVAAVVSSNVAMPSAGAGSGNIRLLVTGGGAFNTCLVERMQALMPYCQVVVPSADIVSYKEAIIFALLGYLRVNGQPNTYASVTGASNDSVGGNLSGRVASPPDPLSIMRGGGWALKVLSGPQKPGT